MDASCSTTIIEIAEKRTDSQPKSERQSRCRVPLNHQSIQTHLASLDVDEELLKVGFFQVRSIGKSSEVLKEVLKGGNISAKDPLEGW
jgi:hypothetical protein